MLTPTTTQSLILGIDRILIHTQDVERVFARFRYEFGLPVVWPITDCGLLLSGGLHVGNMNIEIGRFAGCGLPGTWFYGLGLAQSQPTWEMVNGLVSRKVSHAPPVTLHYEEPVATRSTLTFLRNLLDGQPHTPFWLGRPWGGNTQVCRALAALSTWMVGTAAGSMMFSKLLGSSVVFMCDNQIDRHQERFTELKAKWRRTRQSGPYGIAGIAAVDIELTTTTAYWGRLLDRPDLNTSSIHSFSMGPQLRFHPGGGNRLLGIEFSCTDLESTAQKLIEKRSLVPMGGTRITLSPDRMDGLTIGFSQSPTTRVNSDQSLS
ncbi:MAG: hypothetical protein P0120_20240 [Nitrospira sp.]|nr:hypothetical protein [Nitrospira sp.]